MNKKPPEVFLRLKKIRDFCLENSSQNERWPSYFQRRYLEFISYSELFPKKHFETILELGCGIGYQSAFLSCYADKVIATDLPDEDMETHTPGLTQAKLFLEELKIKNVELLGCSAEDLPFPDNTFDMVYSSHVLEHVPDQELAIREIYRVLKPGGTFFCVVPTSFEKYYSFLNYYLFIISRIPSFLKKRWKKNSNEQNEIRDVKNITKTKTINSFRNYFPFPPPHGHYKDFISEFKDWKPGKWRKKIMNVVPFEFIDQRTTQFLPFMPMLGFLFPLLGTRLHSYSRSFEKNTGKIRLIQYFGINTVMVLNKK